MRAKQLWVKRSCATVRLASATLLTFGSLLTSRAVADDSVVFYGDSGRLTEPANTDLTLPALSSRAGRTGAADRSLGTVAGDPRYAPGLLSRSGATRPMAPNPVAAGAASDVQLTASGSQPQSGVNRADYARAMSQEIQRKQAAETSRRGILARFLPQFSRDKSTDKPASAPPRVASAPSSAVQQAVFRDARNRGAQRSGLETRSMQGRQPQGLFGYLNQSESTSRSSRTSAEPAPKEFKQPANSRPAPSQMSSSRMKSPKAAQQMPRRPLAATNSLVKPIQPSSPVAVANQASRPGASDDSGVVFVTDDSGNGKSKHAEVNTLANSTSPQTEAKLPRPNILHEALRPSPPAASQQPTAQTAGTQRPLIRSVEPAPMVVTAPAATPVEPAAAEPLQVVATQPVEGTGGPAPRPIERSYPKAELAREDTVATSSLPNPVPASQAAPSPAEPAPSPRAVALLAEANGHAQTAATDEEFTHILRRCRHVMAIDHTPAVTQYSRSLGSWALNKRGEIRADSGHEVDAMTDFEDAIRMDKACWRAVHNRGVLLAQAGEFEQAFEAFNKTIDLNPDFAKAYSNRASLFIQAGDFAAAMDDYKQAIEIDPDLAIAHKGRGRVCHMLGYMEWAMQHFDAALLLEPGDATIATCRADLLVDRGRYAAADQAYRHAVELDPKLPSAPRNLAWMQATCPDARFVNATEAVANARRALEMLDGEDEVSLDTLAAALASAGKFEEAIATLQRAIDLAPEGDVPAYQERLELYESGQRFISAPVTAIQQAGYQQSSGY